MTNSLRGAIFSGCKTYRYSLWRRWDLRLPEMVFVMLNPSTADADVDDPTIRKCIGFARRNQCGGIEVVNLFALRSTDPRALLTHPSPVGEHNDVYLRTCARGPNTIVVVAWGANGDRYASTIRATCELLPSRLVCLGATNTGQPAHPLMLPYSRPLTRWSMSARERQA